jgi:hypothetical protein
MPPHDPGGKKERGKFMADHYVALNDGVEGFKYSDFITGAANTVGVNQVELRVQDGTNLTKKDVVNILKAFIRFMDNAQQVSAAGFQVKG